MVHKTSILGYHPLLTSQERAKISKVKEKASTYIICRQIGYKVIIKSVHNDLPFCVQ